MASHKYQVGQGVHYTSNVMRRFGAANGDFRIAKLLPPEGGDLQYRIESAAEPQERGAKESQLDAAGQVASDLT